MLRDFIEWQLHTPVRAFNSSLESLLQHVAMHNPDCPNTLLGGLLSAHRESRRETLSPLELRSSP
jgi:hypothetical protein